MKLSLIWRSVRFETFKAFNTSFKSLLISTMPAAWTVMSVAALIATPMFA